MLYSNIVCPQWQDFNTTHVPAFALELAACEDAQNFNRPDRAPLGQTLSQFSLSLNVLPSFSFFLVIILPPQAQWDIWVLCSMAAILWSLWQNPSLAAVSIFNHLVFFFFRELEVRNLSKTKMSEMKSFARLTFQHLFVQFWCSTRQNNHEGDFGGLKS